MKYPFRHQHKNNLKHKSKYHFREDRNTYLGDLRKYLSQYSSVEKWRDSLLSIYNQDGDQVWLPTSISPSKGV